MHTFIFIYIKSELSVIFLFCPNLTFETILQFIYPGRVNKYCTSSPIGQITQKATDFSFKVSHEFGLSGKLGISVARVQNANRVRTKQIGVKLFAYLERNDSKNFGNYFHSFFIENFIMSIKTQGIHSMKKFNLFFPMTVRESPFTVI